MATRKLLNVSDKEIIIIWGDGYANHPELMAIQNSFVSCNYVHYLFYH